MQGNKTHICHDCSLSVALPKLAHKEKASCPRCHSHLTAYHAFAYDYVLAFAIAAFIFLISSIPYDFIAFSAGGQTQVIDVPSSIRVLIENDYLGLAIIQLLAILLIPGLVLLGIIYLTGALKMGHRPRYGALVFKMIYTLMPWSMAEIFLVGVLVSLIKIISLADIDMGMSFYSFVGFVVCMSAMLMYLDKRQLLDDITDEPHTVQHKKLSPAESVQQTWAYLITAVLLYIPANVLPIMVTRVLGQDEPSTIIGGVILLWHHGSYPIAAVIFIASIAVPVAKLIILAWLNYSVQTKAAWLSQQRVVAYRFTEFIGRWSMVDVFVVAILVSLVQLGNTMSIYPGPAVLAFSAVVIITMQAAHAFDATLIWQNHNNKEQQ